MDFDNALVMVKVANTIRDHVLTAYVSSIAKTIMARSVQTWAYNASMEHAMRRKSVQTLVTAVAEFTGDRCIMPKTKAICDMCSKLGGHNAYDIYENLGDEYVYERFPLHKKVVIQIKGTIKNHQFR